MRRPLFLQVDNANVGAEISTKQVTELPLNLRNVFNFVELNSSVNNFSQQADHFLGRSSKAPPTRTFRSSTLAAGIFGTTAFLLDGAWDASEGWGGVIYVPSPDNVQEFKVQQNYVHRAIWLEHRKCDQRCHQIRRQQLARSCIRLSAQWRLSTRTTTSTTLTGSPKPNSHRNQFGVALGGPVYIPGIYKQRDKTFFFFNYEGHRRP